MTIAWKQLAATVALIVAIPMSAAHAAGYTSPATDVGDRDVDDGPDAGEAFAQRMDLLSGYGLRARCRRYADGGQVTVPARAVTDTLRFAFEVR